MGINHLEKTSFKNEFTNAKTFQSGSMSYNVNIGNKFRILKYYLKQYITNPKYLNSSIIDTIKSFWFYYIIKHNHLNFFDYITWDENLINETLIKEYGWEIDPESSTTWRIGDGTAAFYNYIYYIVAGFTENDTFRSNQIRENQLSREQALILTRKDNLPRWKSIEWYCNTIKIDFKSAVQTINDIKKLYL
jgi:hypothetical protein